jgi:hypothetical protein
MVFPSTSHSALHDLFQIEISKEPQFSTSDEHLTLPCKASCRSLLENTFVIQVLT